jgi:hypothetical protein
MTDNNMALWDKVQKTDPSHTKKVNQRGGFTAIDAHYQVMEATRVFGPLGIGWGYSVEHKTVSAGDTVLAVADVTMWHSSNKESLFGPVRGMAKLLSATGIVDTDAGKKAATDALTKSLSQLGFNADVFLGMFDDPEYVKQLDAEFNPQPIVTEENLKDIDELCEKTGITKEAICKDQKVDCLKKLTIDQFNSVKKRLENRVKK